MTSLEKSIETTGKSEVKVLKLPRLKVIRLKRALKAFFPVDTTDFSRLSQVIRFCISFALWRLCACDWLITAYFNLSSYRYKNLHMLQKSQTIEDLLVSQSCQIQIVLISEEDQTVRP